MRSVSYWSTKVKNSLTLLYTLLGLMFITEGRSIALKRRLLLLITFLTGILSSVWNGDWLSLWLTWTGILCTVSSGCKWSWLSLLKLTLPSNCSISEMVESRTLISTVACSVIEQLSLLLTYLNSLKDWRNCWLGHCTYFLYFVVCWTSTHLSTTCLSSFLDCSCQTDACN